MKDEDTVLDENEHLRSVIKIECDHNEGTAVCVHSSDTVGNIFLTCAHVVQHKTQSVILRYNGRVFNGKVIFAVRQGVPYDIAVIVCERIPNIKQCQVSDIIPTVGQKVFAIGYGCKENIPSTVFGYVVKVPVSMLMTTCNVRLGFSGGPVFTSDRKLLGLTIGKLSVGNVNFVLPSAEFMVTIKNYILINDNKILDNLESKCPRKKILWSNGIPNLNICHI